MKSIHINVTLNTLYTAHIRAYVFLYSIQLTGCLLVALFPDPEQQGLLGRDPEAPVQRRASGRNRTAAGRAARQRGARVQTDQGLHGRLTGIEREAAGQLLDLRKAPTQFLFIILCIYVWDICRRLKGVKQ